MVTKSSAPAMVAQRAMVTRLIRGWVVLAPAGVGQPEEVIADTSRGVRGHDRADPIRRHASGARPGHPTRVIKPKIIPDCLSWRNRPAIEAEVRERLAREATA